MKIGIGNDHAAVELKNIISEHLKERGCEVVNFGTDTSESFDYPIAGYKVGKAVANGDVDLGILICGTGVGMPPRARSRAWTSGRLPRDGAPGDARADNRDIKRFCHSASQTS